DGLIAADPVRGNAVDLFTHVFWRVNDSLLETNALLLSSRERSFNAFQKKQFILKHCCHQNIYFDLFN
ncbi:hypothetical protein KFY75_25855, partial [Salmonella enterica subsp. enterica serovar Typhimurium]|nr:hypothetical protein [Salmonella enterica subsp. enterica serovar Typhimurium]